VVSDTSSEVVFFQAYMVLSLFRAMAQGSLELCQMAIGMNREKEGTCGLWLIFCSHQGRFFLSSFGCPSDVSECRISAVSPCGSTCFPETSR
jgi:hypothetical protein